MFSTRTLIITSRSVPTISRDNSISEIETFLKFSGGGNDLTNNRGFAGSPSQASPKPTALGRQAVSKRTGLDDTLMSDPLTLAHLLFDSGFLNDLTGHNCTCGLGRLQLAEHLSVAK